MTSPQPTRIVFLGCGQAARIHSRALRNIPGVQLAYASTDIGRADSLRREYNGVKSFGSYDEALYDRSIDVVIVATPTASHQELALRAVHAGKHVVIEKPAFLSASSANAVRDAATLRSRHVFVAENYIYKPIAALLRTLVAGGSLGEVRFVSLNATRWQPAVGWRAIPALSGGGALFEAGVHWVSFAARLGLDVSAIQGWPVGSNAGGDRSSLVVLQYANGAVATLAHSWELRGTLRGARLSKVQGTHGSLTFESNGFASVATGRSTRFRTHLRDTLGYRAMHSDFLRVVRNGGDALYTLDMAQADLALLETAQAGLSMNNPSDRPVALL